MKSYKILLGIGLSTIAFNPTVYAQDKPLTAEPVQVERGTFQGLEYVVTERDGKWFTDYDLNGKNDAKELTEYVLKNGQGMGLPLLGNSKRLKVQLSNGYTCQIVVTKTSGLGGLFEKLKDFKPGDLPINPDDLRKKLPIPDLDLDDLRDKLPMPDFDLQDLFDKLPFGPNKPGINPAEEKTILTLAVYEKQNLMQSSKILIADENSDGIINQNSLFDNLCVMGPEGMNVYRKGEKKVGQSSAKGVWAAIIADAYKQAKLQDKNPLKLPERELKEAPELPNKEQKEEEKEKKEEKKPKGKVY